MLYEVLIVMSLWVFWFPCGTCHDFDGKLLQLRWVNGRR